MNVVRWAVHRNIRGSFVLAVQFVQNHNDDFNLSHTLKIPVIRPLDCCFSSSDMLYVSSRSKEGITYLPTYLLHKA
jgi:hypothetical protein